MSLMLKIPFVRRLADWWERATAPTDDDRSELDCHTAFLPAGFDKVEKPIR